MRRLWEGDGFGGGTAEEGTLGFMPGSVHSIELMDKGGKGGLIYMKQAG